MTIRWRTAVRVLPAVWFGPAIGLLALGYATSVPSADRYGLAASASGSAALPFIAAYVCAAATWEGARLRRARIWGGPWARSRVAIAAMPIGVPVLFGLVAVLLAIGLQLAQAGASVPDLRIIAVAACDLLAWGVVGFAIGVTVPFAAAVPVGLILPFLWLAFVPAMDPVSLRHITGMFRDCCLGDEDLAPVAVVASVLVDVAFGVAAWIVATAGANQRWRSVVVAGAMAGLTSIGAAALVSGLDFAPAVARDSSLLTCRPLTATELCLWPERADRFDELSDVTTGVLERWRSMGIAVPSTVTEANHRVAPAGSLVVSFNDVHDPDAAILALARGAVPPLPECPSGTPGVLMATTGAVAEPYLEAWYASAGGLSPAAFAAAYAQYSDVGGPAVTDVVRDVEAASPDRRARWIAKLAGYVTTCEPVEPQVTVDP